jgi:hypothetical protein
MTIETHIQRRFARSVVCALAAAAFFAPAALADPPQGHRAPTSDVVDRYLANDRAHASRPVGTPDVLERYVESRAGIVGLTPDGYQPRSQRGETQAASVSQASADGFGWNDAGIGAAVGFAFSLIAGGTLLAARRRQRAAHA